MDVKITRFIALASLCLSLTVFSCKTQKNKDISLIKPGATLKMLADGYDFTEGPAVDKNGDVYFTDQPNDQILKWSFSDNKLSQYLHPAGRANGLYFNHEGQLLAAADEKNELWQIDQNKQISVLLDDYKGKKLNGPNDIWVHPSGSIYFTDPYYQRPWWQHTEPQQNAKRVYFLASAAAEPVIATNTLFEQPNGIIGTPDGKKLYVADIDAEKTYEFGISTDGILLGKKLFTNMGSDGMTIDHLGNLYLTGDGVTVFNAQGKKIHHIAVPESWTANVTFGGLEQNVLFITAMDAVYTLDMAVHGVR